MQHENYVCLCLSLLRQTHICWCLCPVEGQPPDFTSIQSRGTNFHFFPFPTKVDGIHFGAGGGWAWQLRLRTFWSLTCSHGPICGSAKNTPSLVSPYQSTVWQREGPEWGRKEGGNREKERWHTYIRKRGRKSGGKEGEMKRMSNGEETDEGGWCCDLCNVVIADEQRTWVTQLDKRFNGLSTVSDI